MMRSDTSLSRKLVFPLLIVAVALGFALWTTSGNTQSSGVVERFVRELCMEAANGGDVRKSLSLSDPYVAQGVSQQIANVCAAHGGLVENIVIKVSPGDLYPQPGSETATHSAMLGDGHIEMLGLRVVANKGFVRVLGYWIPQDA